MVKKYGKNTYAQSETSPEWEDGEQGLLIEFEEPTSIFLTPQDLDMALAAICGDMPYSAGWYSASPAKGNLSFGEVTIGCVADTSENRQKLLVIAEKLAPIVGESVSVSYYEDGEQGTLVLIR